MAERPLSDELFGEGKPKRDIMPIEGTKPDEGEEEYKTPLKDWRGERPCCSLPSKRALFGVGIKRPGDRDKTVEYYDVEIDTDTRPRASSTVASGAGFTASVCAGGGSSRIAGPLALGPARFLFDPGKAGWSGLRTEGEHHVPTRNQVP